MPGITFLERMNNQIRRLMREKPDATIEDVEAAFNRARASAGGSAAAAKRKEADQGDGDQGETIAAAEWYEDRSRAVNTALQRRYPGQTVFCIRTSDAEVVYEVWPAPGSGMVPAEGDRYYRADYTIADTGAVTIGDPVAVEQRTDYVPVQLDDGDGDHYQSPMRRTIRLDDAGGLPDWQMLHEVGDWAVAHGSGARIQFTPEIGDAMIANFESNAIGRRVPLDEVHSTGKRGRALAKLQEMRWGGGERDGLPGEPEPDGITKKYLFGRWQYNNAGREVLLDEQYMYASPEYTLDYVRKRDGKSFGPALLACAATNDPYLRLRSLQGEPSLESLTLEDGAMNGPATPPNVPAPTTGSTGERTVTLAEFEAYKADQERVIKLAQEESARATRRLFEQRVESDVRLRIERGLAPALARILQPIMLSCDPDAAGTIRLSEDPGTAPLNFYGAVLELMDALPRMNMIARTVQYDHRPGESAGVVQLDEARKIGRGMRAEAGLPVANA